MEEKSQYTVREKGRKKNPHLHWSKEDQEGDDVAYDKRIKLF